MPSPRNPDHAAQCANRGQSFDDEIEIAALRVEGLAGGRTENVRAVRGELAAEPFDIIAKGFGDAVRGEHSARLCCRCRSALKLAWLRDVNGGHFAVLAVLRQFAEACFGLRRRVYAANPRGQRRGAQRLVLRGQR